MIIMEKNLLIIFFTIFSEMVLRKRPEILSPVGTSGDTRRFGRDMTKGWRDKTDGKLVVMQKWWEALHGLNVIRIGRIYLLKYSGHRKGRTKLSGLSRARW